MKKLLISILIAISVFSSFAVQASAENSDATQPVASAKVYIDENMVEFTENTGVPFESDSGRTMVPLRVVTEKFGVIVDWNEETESAILKKGDNTLIVTVNSKTMKFNGETDIICDEAPTETNGRIYLPIRAVAEAFGNYVLWNEQLKSVFILDDDYIDFRDMFTYNGELSKYVNSVVVSAVYNGDMSKDEFKNYWLNLPAEKADIYLKAVATDKKALNPDYDIHINFWYPSNEVQNSCYLASVSSFSYDTGIYNPFDITEINELNQ